MMFLRKTEKIFHTKSTFKDQHNLKIRKYSLATNTSISICILLQIALVLKAEVHLFAGFYWMATSKAKGRFRSDINLLFPLFKTLY